MLDDILENIIDMNYYEVIYDISMLWVLFQITYHYINKIWNKEYP